MNSDGRSKNMENTAYEETRKLIRIDDLFLRWPGALQKDIVRAWQSGKLTAYHLLIEREDGSSSVLPCDLEYEDTSPYWDAHIRKINRNYVFLLDEVEKFEKIHPEYKKKRTDLDQEGIYISCIENEDLKKEIRELNDKISKIRAEHEAEINEKLHGKRRNSYLNLIDALLKDRKMNLDHDAVGKLVRIIEISNIDLGDDTVRKILSEIKLLRENQKPK